MAHDVVGVVGVAHRVGAAQQHLQQDVRGPLADLRQPVPGVFLQESQCDVEGGAAPALEREQLRQFARDVGHDRQHVGRAHARGQQRLMAVAQRGVGDQHLLLVEHPLREAGRAQRLQPLPRAVGHRAAAVHLGQHRLGQWQRGQRAAGHLGVAVHRGLGQEAQQLGRAVAARGELQQLGRFLDEARRDLAGRKVRMVDHVLQELQVGGDTADAELAQRPVHALAGLDRRRRPGRHLDQQRVVVRRDHGAGVGRATVEPDPEASRAAVGRQAAVVGQEAVLRVLGRHAALQRVASQRNVGLQRHAGRVAAVLRFLVDADVAAFADADLGAHDVDAGDQLGHRVLDLDARVDLDEVAAVVVGVHQELDRAGMRVVHRPHQGQGAVAQRGALFGTQVRRRGALDDLLVAPLHGAVTFVQVHQVAMQVAEDLHLHMARAADQFLEVDLVVAERRQRLTPRSLQRRRQVGRRLDDAHAAPTAAPAGLEHDREADALGQPLAFGQVGRQRRGGRHHRHAGGHRGVACCDLVAQRAHHFGARPDPAQAGGDDRVGEVGVLRQESVARVDGVDAGVARDAQDVFAVQVGRERLLALADDITLVGLEAVQRLPVLLGVDAHGADAHLVGRAHDADRDFGTVGDQDRADRIGLHRGTPVGRSERERERDPHHAGSVHAYRGREPFSRSPSGWHCRPQLRC